MEVNPYLQVIALTSLLIAAYLIFGAWKRQK